ncbi:MAG: phage major capsid protein [Clostridiales bacterium]|nr:phage major capsid protein [Clostridiales bacterium]MBQ1298157.1 phage major capsid protein [Clostridiales bacterium]MBQ1572648.1 phage major capsid protein [Clostridiales bacterium]MBQ1575277.1 phage major capsid protein [Clostridiales bacterium]
MSEILTRGSLLPPVVTNQMFNKVRGKSSLARLSGSEPIPFNGETVFTFSMDSEVDLVGENGAKSNGGGTVAAIQMIPVKVEYGLRVSDEFRYGSDEIRLQYLTSFAEGFANKVARGIDIMAFHGVNPRSKQKASVITNKNFDDLISNTVVFDSSHPGKNIVDAIALVEGAEHDVSGLAISPAMKNALAKLTKGSSSYEPMFPELGWGATVGAINGLPADANSTVSFNSGADRAIVGNFASFFKWGFAKQIPIEVIEYGNPDNSDLGDLKGHNQVYLRGEAYVGWGIIDPSAFAIVKASASA